MAEKEEEGERLDRADLWRLHEYCANEIRTSLDFAHRNLSSTSTHCPPSWQR